MLEMMWLYIVESESSVDGKREMHSSLLAKLLPMLCNKIAMVFRYSFPNQVSNKSYNHLNIQPWFPVYYKKVNRRSKECLQIPYYSYLSLAVATSQ